MIIQKRKLIARTLNVGAERIVFNRERLKDIEEAITKQDIRDLVGEGAIHVREIRGRAKIEKRGNRRRAGSIRKKVKQGKRDYINYVRRMRRYIRELQKQNKLTSEQVNTMKSQIRAKTLQSKTQVREQIASGDKK